MKIPARKVSQERLAALYAWDASTLGTGRSACATLLTVMAAVVLLAPSGLPAEKRNSAVSPAATETAGEDAWRMEMVYRERANRNPQDAEAFAGMASLQVQRGDYSDAITSYRQLLKLAPHDHDARVGLGRALAFNGQFDDALGTFQALAQERPNDTDALEGMARVQMWAGRPALALPILLDLTAHYPANPEYPVALARVEMNLHHYSEARRTLATLLTAHPRNRDAQLQLADLDLRQGYQAAALRRFNSLISQDPADVEALEGNARIAYYRGDLVYAHDLAAKIVQGDPRNVTALLLLADLERALHHAPQARALVERAEAINPHNADARELADALRLESQPTFHTSASFAREISSGSPSNAEDLSAFGYDTTWSFFALPRSESFVSLDYLPSQSPSGGTEGAVGPEQVLYRQTTYLTPHITVRGGVGLARFGPGDLVGVPTQTQPITSAGARPLGFVGFNYAAGRKLTVDFTDARTAITYTPTAVRLGVMEDRISAALDYRFDSKTELRFEPFVTDDATISFAHALGLAGSNLKLVNQADHNRGRGASLTFSRKVVHKGAMGFDLGYDGLAYGITGGLEKPYLGFFNPAFYQRHYLSTHLVGRIHGPLGFDFSTGTGVQQVEHGTPLKPALLLSPAFTLKASPRFTLTLGYTHYDSSQSLGTLRGDAARLSTDWKF
jgi:tetratricopeptide (TPR) repeat protein